jgi:putative transposase
MTTNATIDLQALLEKTTDSDFLREMIGYTAQRLMDLEVEGLTGAPHGSRSAESLAISLAQRDIRPVDWNALARSSRRNSRSSYPASGISIRPCWNSP